MQSRLAIALAALALLAVVVPVPAAADGHQTDLRSGGTHWIGQTLADEGYPANTQIEIRRNARVAATVTSDERGRIRFETANLSEGQYTIAVASGGVYERFELEQQTIDAEVVRRRALADGNTFTIELSVSSNRDNYDLQLALVEDAPVNLTDRIDRATFKNGSATVEASSVQTVVVTVEGFPNGANPLRVSGRDSTAETTVDLRVRSNRCQWGDPLPLDADGAVVGERNGSYWQGQTVAFRPRGGCDAHGVAPVGEENLTEVTPTEGRVLINTTDFPTGEYVLRRPDGTVASGFSVADAALSAEANETHVLLTSNRPTYTLSVHAPERSPEELAAALSGVTVADDRAVIEASERTAIRVNESATTPLDLRFTVTDTGESVAVTFQPERQETPTPTPVPTTTATPTPTTTLPPTSPTPTPTDGGDGGPISDVGTPGFGVLPALIAIAAAAAVLLGRRRR